MTEHRSTTEGPRVRSVDAAAGLPAGFSAALAALIGTAPAGDTDGWPADVASPPSGTGEPTPRGDLRAAAVGSQGRRVAYGRYREEARVAARSYRLDLPARVAHILQVLRPGEVAEVVGATASIVGRWRTGAVTPTGRQTEVLLDLDYVLATYAFHFPAPTFSGWLAAPNAFLKGARPRDVLVADGPTPLLRALNGEHAGSAA